MKPPYHAAFPCLSPADIQLLQACTQAETRAQTAWDQWRKHNQVESAGPRAQAMFAMVYANLLASSSAPEATLLKGVHKRCWYANQMRIAGINPLLEQLKAGDIAVMVFNDVSMVKGHYADIGYRSIECADLLVKQKDWKNSLSCAGDTEWRQLPEQSFGSSGSLSATAFKGPEGQSLRIWTNLFVAEPQEDTEHRLWQNTRSIELGSEPVLALGVADQLLRLCIEALRDDDTALTRYADAITLLRLMDSNDDWTRLVWQAQRYEGILPLRNMLAFLQQHFAVDVPAWVLPALHKMAISHLELLQYHRACDSPALRFKSACLRLAHRLGAGETSG